MATTPEAEEFAAVLRRLKERSGHSYGVLAGRLHVSTSTLHRYCNGDAVPAEFAVVERLARLCGAEREELLALHRRWILADEARRRGRDAARAADAAAAASAAAGRVPSGDGGPAAVAGTGPGPGPAPEEETRPRDAVDAGAAPPPAGETPGPARASGLARGPGPGPGPAPEAGGSCTVPEAGGSRTVPEAGGSRAVPEAGGSRVPGAGGARPAPGAGRVPEAPEQGGPEAGPGRGGAGSPAESVAPAARRADRGGGVAETAVTAVTAGGVGGPGGSGGSGGSGGVRRTDDAAEDEVPGLGGGRDGEAAGSTASAPDRAALSARRKRLLVALAAAAVVALAVPAAVVAGHSGTSGDRADGDATSAPPSGTGGPGPAPSASVSGSPSGTPSPSASSGAPTPSPDVPPPAGNGAPAPAGVPLRVGISSYNWDSPCGQYYLMGRSPEEIPPPPPPQDYRSWARALDGVDAGDLRLQLTATGKTRDSVVVTAVHVRITGRAEPLAWNAYSMGEGCGSGITPQTFDVDLDKPRPVLRPVAGQQGDITVPATDFPYKVASNDPQVFNLRLHTASHDVHWYVEVDWSSGDRRGTLRIDDEGKPFRTSALAGRPLHDYRPDLGGIWKPREE